MLPKIRYEWPHCLAIDTGSTHPTAATMGTVSPDGHYFFMRFYAQSKKGTMVHASNLMEMVRGCKQVGRRTFFSIMCDFRDPQFITDIIIYTNGIISPGVIKTPKRWTKKQLRQACIGKIYTLQTEGKFHVNEDDPYYPVFKYEWGNYKYKAKLDEPDKINDDIMDTLLTIVHVLHPMKVEDLDYRMEIDKEPPIEHILGMSDRENYYQESMN